jgi:hypothetical protein
VIAMLTNEQLIPALTHPDHDVRSMVVERLRKSFDPTPATMDDAWKAVDAQGMKRGAWWLRDRGDVPWTESSVQRLLEEVRRAQDKHLREELEEALAAIDLHLLMRHRESVLSVLASSNLMRQSVEDRFQFAHEPPERLWQELGQLSSKGEHHRFNEADLRRVDDLVEGLTAHADFAAEHSMAMLREPKEPSWLEIFAVQLLGEIRHLPALELVLDRLGDEESDAMSEESCRAAARIGGADAVAIVEHRFATATWTWKLYAANVLERLTLPESEQALMRLIPIESDATILSNLGSALCRLFTADDGAEILRQLVLEDRYDAGMVDVKGELMTMAKVTGYRPPEAEQWERHLKELNARTERLISEMEHGRNYDFPSVDPLTAIDSIDRGLAPVGTYRRDEPRVGRNDPCPCGSGRKYKKCCGA